MDTLHVSQPNQPQSGSKHSSRAPSPCRIEQMSRDRDVTDSASSGGGSGGIRFRNSSPSTHRRSRERERDRDKDRDITTITDMTADHSHTDLYDDSRLSGNDEIGYSSYTAEELDSQNLNNSTAQSVDSESKVGRHQRTNSTQALDRLTTKIACTKESIRKEQTSRDDNVNEYLKLAAGADKQQIQRIKAVFEKKNQKSAHSISQLQKKLESYSKRFKDLQQQQTLKQQQLQQQQQIQQHRQPREMLRDVGQGLRNVGGNIRDGVTGLSATVMSKPREFAHLIKNKFGSADNINQLQSNPDLHELNLNSSQNQMDTSGNHQQQQHHHHHHHSSSSHHHHPHPHGGTSTPNNTGTLASVGSSTNTGGIGGGGVGGGVGGGGSGKFNSEHGSECSSVTSDSMPGGSGKNQHRVNGQYPIHIKDVYAELRERKEDYDKLKERLERLETTQKEVSELTLALESERYRAERLEEQVNDLTELHQNEIENLKQAMADMEEKVQYQSDERLRDVNEVLENCQTRISKMEHLSQQQYVTVEGIDNSNARALVVKLINVVLTVLQVVLLLVATAAGIIMPFLKTRVRVLTTLFFILLIIFVIRQWPDVRDIGAHMVRHLKETLVVK